MRVMKARHDSWKVTLGAAATGVKVARECGCIVVSGPDWNRLRRLLSHRPIVIVMVAVSGIDTGSYFFRLPCYRSAGAMSMLPASMDEDLEGGAEEAMKKMEGRKVMGIPCGGVDCLMFLVCLSCLYPARE